MTMLNITRRNLFGATMLAAAVFAVPALAQDKPSLKFSAVFS